MDDERAEVTAGTQRTTDGSTDDVARHSRVASTVTRRVRTSGEVRGAANWALRVLVLVVFVTSLIMIGLPWLLAAAAGS